MKRTICAASLCLVALSPALAGAAGGNLNSSVRGDYAFSGEAVCLGSSAVDPFSGFHAQNPGANIVSFTVEGVRRFNGDGTGIILKSRAVAINHNVNRDQNGNFAGLGTPSVETFTGNFTYTVAPDHSIHIDQGPLKTTMVLGPAANSPYATVIWTGIKIDGHVSEDFKTIATATPMPDPSHPESALEIGHNEGAVNGQPADQTRFCHRSRIMIRISGGEARDDRLSANPFLRP